MPHDRSGRTRRGLTGIIAPSATGAGETLALFDDNVPAGRYPTVVTEDVWLTLPPRPRHGLRPGIRGTSSSHQPFGLGFEVVDDRVDRVLRLVQVVEHETRALPDRPGLVRAFEALTE